MKISSIGEPVTSVQSRIMGDTEEIVMTAARREGKAIVRLERSFTSDIDRSKVHHVAGGPYKGILINKASADLVETEPPEGRLEFLAYMVNENRDNEPIQDHWTMRFWFRGTEDGLVMKNTYTDYFKDLMNPTDFPKNYIGFIKKALVLLKGYTTIKRLELQVEQTHAPAPEDAIPPIRSYTTVFTPAASSFSFIPEVCIKSKSFLTFKVKAAGDVRIALCSIYGDVKHKTHEIVIGADGNTKSYIRDCATGSIRTQSMTMNIVSDEKFRYFWITWSEKQVDVGRGAQYGYGRFLHFLVPPKRQFKVNCLAVATSKATRGHWEFAELLDPEMKAGRSAKRKLIREQYMWLARKYRMLHYLEEAFPNVVKIEDLVSNCKIRRSDLMAVAMVLGELQGRGLLEEVGDGYWRRSHGGGVSHANDEIKLVKVMPVLSASDQPTIAIITTLFCEKLAVDVMIEDKTTYVKCKTEGESQVYTTGRIGKHRVVSTKLSCTPGEASDIAAGNSVTRLLGTFSKVEHVLLVGVGGGVWHYGREESLTPGDVVVSMPSTATNAMYTKCRGKRNSGSSGDAFQFSIRTWHSHDETLRRLVQKLAGSEQCTNELDLHMKSAMIHLSSDGDSKFQKPASPNEETTVICGAVGSISFLADDENAKMSFSASNGIQAFDGDFEAVLESLDGNRNESYLLIRGIADYQYGCRKEWQPFASLAAAAFMKTLILAMN